MKKTASNNLSVKKIYSKWFVVALVIVIVIAASIYGVVKYRSSQDNKIYSVGQTMKYPDFTASVTNAQVKAINLPIDENTVVQYGSLATDENCDVLSKDPTPSSGYQSIFGSKNYTPPNPSPYNFCIRRNDSRKVIKDYSGQNKQLTLNFNIKAKGIVNSKNVRIQVLPDSGRKLSTPVDNFNGNEFIFGNMEKDMSNIFDFKPYVPYFQSDLAGDVNPGLTRTGYIYTDVRNSETSADFSLTYIQNGKSITKITRIYLNK